MGETVSSQIVFTPWRPFTMPTTWQMVNNASRQNWSNTFKKIHNSILICRCFPATALQFRELCLQDRRGLWFSMFCNVQIYWNLLILLNKMSLQRLTLSCILNSYKLGGIAIQSIQIRVRHFMTIKKTPGNSMWQSPLWNIYWPEVLFSDFFLHYLYEETFLRRQKIKTYYKTFHVFSLSCVIVLILKE